MVILSTIEAFGDECRGMIVGMNSEDLVKANKFISTVSKIYQKYHFVHLPDFLDDFMNGLATSEIIKKYRLRDHNIFNALTRNILGFKGRRSGKSHSNNMETNLNDPDWQSQYELFMSYSKIFNTPMEDMLNNNILIAFFIRTIFDSEYISNLDIKKKTFDSYHKFDKSIYPLSDTQKRESFEKYMETDLDFKLATIINYLAKESHLTTMNGDVSILKKYTNIKEQIHEMLHEAKDGISYNSLVTKIMNEFPLLKYTQNMGIWEPLIEELENGGLLIRKHAPWKHNLQYDQLFTPDNYETKIRRIKKQEYVGRIKFFGRNITPDLFISELKALDPGDLDDLDDQVTRVAGLILSDALLPQSPRKDMEEFDFMVDVTNHRFRPEQEKMMKKLNFRIMSKIFHCKVMIDNEIDMGTMTRLKGMIPDGEQGIVFTCRPVSAKIMRMMLDDRTIQIIDEGAIRDWCSITPTIPCRRQSVARAMYGDDTGKLVQIKSLNYESGLATVEMILDGMETTCPIGCLKEVLPHISNPNDLEPAMEKYVDFLRALKDVSGDSFEEGIITNIVNVYSTEYDLMKNVHPEHFDGSHPEIPYDRKSKHNKYVQFENVYVTIGAKSSGKYFECTCGHSFNEVYYRTLCKHLVAAINHLCMNESEWNEALHNMHRFTNKLIGLQIGNVERMIGAIFDVLGSETQEMFKKYLQKHANI